MADDRRGLPDLRPGTREPARRPPRPRKPGGSNSATRIRRGDYDGDGISVPEGGADVLARRHAADRAMRTSTRASPRCRRMENTGSFARFSRGEALVFDTTLDRFPGGLAGTERRRRVRRHRRHRSPRGSGPGGQPARRREPLPDRVADRPLRDPERGGSGHLPLGGGPGAPGRDLRPRARLRPGQPPGRPGDHDQLVGPSPTSSPNHRRGMSEHRPEAGAPTRSAGLQAWSAGL